MLDYRDHKCPYKGRREAGENWKDCCLRMTQLHVAGLGEEGRGHKPRNVGMSRSWKGRGDGFSPRNPRRAAAPPRATSILASETLRDF